MKVFEKEKRHLLIELLVFVLVTVAFLLYVTNLM